jgi:uncharacterized MAPEG superfamily protein
MRSWRTLLVRWTLIPAHPIPTPSSYLERPGSRSRKCDACDANTSGYAGFALSAALAQTLAPTDAQVVNLLGFHVIAKLLVHYPAYVGNVAVVRTVAHGSATAALVDVCWRLAAGN